MKQIIILLLLLCTNNDAGKSNTQKTNLDLMMKPSSKMLYTTILYGECRGEPNIGILAVMVLIENRLKHKDFPQDTTSVLLQRNQFYVDTTLVVSDKFKTKLKSIKYKPIHNYLYFANPNQVKNKKLRRWILRQKGRWFGNQYFYNV